MKAVDDRPRPVRTAGGPSDRGGRAAGARGRRGPRQDPCGDRQPDGLPRPRREAVPVALLQRLPPAEGADPRRASWRERSKRSARPSRGSRSMTGSSVSGRTSRRGSAARRSTSACANPCLRTFRRARRSRRQRRSATVGCPRCSASAPQTSRPGSALSSTARQARSALLQCSSPGTSAHTSPRSATRRTSTSCGRSAPTPSIDYTQEDFTKNGERYDVVFDAVGKHSFRRCTALAEPRRELRRDRGAPQLPPGTRDQASRRPEGAVPDPALPARGRPLPRDLVEAGEYRPVIDRTYAFEDVVEANRYVETGQKTGNVVLRVVPSDAETR